MSRWWVVSYDIADDGRRRWIAEILERYGQRVQWSVFECSLEDAVLEELRIRLRAELDGEEDSLRCYPRLDANVTVQAIVGQGKLAL